MSANPSRGAILVVSPAHCGLLYEVGPLAPPRSASTEMWMHSCTSTSKANRGPRCRSGICQGFADVGRTIEGCRVMIGVPVGHVCPRQWPCGVIAHWINVHGSRLSKNVAEM